MATAVTLSRRLSGVRKYRVTGSSAATAAKAASTAPARSLPPARSSRSRAAPTSSAVPAWPYSTYRSTYSGLTRDTSISSGPGSAHSGRARATGPTVRPGVRCPGSSAAQPAPSRVTR
ncbi:hypothetical protein O1M54_09655 [Streptomyces diastatochromogenes]|nr:hypothetical protein [Streptomyces diastatochromogenes]